MAKTVSVTFVDAGVVSFGEDTPQATIDNLVDRLQEIGFYDVMVETKTFPVRMA